MIIEQAPAKLNLALHVRARRGDGYHELETLFAFVRHGDVVRVEKGGAGLDFRMTGPFAANLNEEADNLVTRAARRFGELLEIEPNWQISLEKNLPVASGIGGGSADAAATLQALAALHDVPQARLFPIAEELGSDVPACLLGRTALGRGRGEQLTQIEGAPGMAVLLVNPLVGVSTAAVFARWDQVDRGGIAALPALAAAAAGRNDLEAPARTLAPEIDAVLAFLARQPGATLSRMSGSGATCFALFDSAEACSQAARRVPEGWWSLETALA